MFRTLVGLFVLSAPLFAAPADLKGKWELEGLRCKSGEAPKDVRDVKVKMEFQEENFRVDMQETDGDRKVEMNQIGRYAANSTTLFMIVYTLKANIDVSASEGFTSATSYRFEQGKLFLVQPKEKSDEFCGEGVEAALVFKKQAP
ncbi:hypothetical protein K2X33_10175 [bacterium]|nr:hypothetical protein [bacterium]